MSEESERQKQLVKVIEIQRNKISELEGKQSKEKGFGDYVAQTQFYSNMPTDPYSHQYQLLNRPHKDVKDFQDLLDADIILSNIQGSRTMLLLQRDFHFITRMFDMAKRSNGIMQLFKPLYYSWKGQLRMTSALKGKERSLQSFLEPEVSGESFAFPIPSAKKKKKKNVQDYLTPQEENIYG